jgi:hypothetical protein
MIFIFSKCDILSFYSSHEEVQVPLRRPHSAKPIRSFVPQVLGEDSIEEARHFLKSGKRHLASAVSVSNDLSRLLPKKIHHDKEQLYHENLQLKASLNEVNEENMRLKTKIALYQREKDRLHKTDNQTLTKGKSSSNLNARGEVPSSPLRNRMGS